MPRISKVKKDVLLQTPSVEEPVEKPINNTEETNVQLQSSIINETTPPTLAKKRGRRSKKELLELQIQKEQMENGDINNTNNNVNVVLSEVQTSVTETTSNPPPKKKGRKSNKKPENEIQNNVTQEPNNIPSDEQEEVVEQPNKPPMKKRGRKPKGGKVIQQVLPLKPTVEMKKNVIMHLKCSLKDLDNYSGYENIYPFNGETIGSTNVNKSNILDTFSYEVLRSNTNEKSELSLIQDNTYYKQESDSDNEFHNMKTKDNGNQPQSQQSSLAGNETSAVLSYKPLDNDFEIKYKLIELNKDNDKLLKGEEEHTTTISSIDANKNEIILRQQEIDKREINKKLKLLEQRLHKNQMNDKKSACFWCTYEFDNPTIYIPKHSINDKHYVYGCFCSPECAVAHLMEEKIDTSVKFERYSLLNHMYSKVYGYEKNIKPAPHPHYILDKYYGNLSIQEYRSLFRKERLFLVIDKPLTHILPELIEDNDDYFINNMIIPSNNNTNQQQNKKKMSFASQKQTKSGIINESFGI